MAWQVKTFGFVAAVYFFIILDVSGLPAQTTMINKQSSMLRKMASPPQERCDEFYFYDHGTEHCEHCKDICKHADIQGTMNQCWEKCQSYALIQWPPQPDKPNTPDEEDASDSTSFPLGAKIILPVLAVLALAGAVLGLVFVRRRKNQNTKNNRKPRTRTQERAVEKIEMDPLDDTARENGSMSTAASWRATQGTETFVSTGGIQEEGIDSIAGRSQAEGGRTTVVVQATESDSRDNLAGSLRFPVLVSPEGHSASFAMALPHSPMMTRASRPTLQRPVSRPDSDEDLDSTELKTLLPSLSEDSLLSGACGGQTSASGGL